MQNKTIIILMCIAVAGILITAFYFDGRFDTKEKTNSQTLLEQSTEDYEDMKNKANHLMNLHNSIVLDLENILADPIDYGYDLNIGWTDVKEKRMWCNSVLRHIDTDKLFVWELDIALSALKDVPNKTPKLIENIEEDKELHKAMIGQLELERKIFSDFACYDDSLNDLR